MCVTCIGGGRASGGFGGGGGGDVATGVRRSERDAVVRFGAAVAPPHYPRIRNHAIDTTAIRARDAI